MNSSSLNSSSLNAKLGMPVFTVGLKCCYKFNVRPYISFPSINERLDYGRINTHAISAYFILVRLYCDNDPLLSLE